MAVLQQNQIEGGGDPTIPGTITAPAGTNWIQIQCTGAGGSGKYHGGGGGAWAIRRVAAAAGQDFLCYAGRGGQIWISRTPTDAYVTRSGITLCRAGCGSNASDGSPGTGGVLVTGDSGMAGGNGARNTSGLLAGAGGGGAGRAPCRGVTPVTYVGGSLGGGNGGLVFQGIQIILATQGLYGGGGGGAEGNQTIGGNNNGGNGRILIQFES